MAYVCRRAGKSLGTPSARWIDDEMWQFADTDTIDNWRWPEEGVETAGPQGVHQPAVQLRLVWDDQHLAVRFDVNDQYVIARHDQFNEQVSHDSCCEFFVAPFATSEDDTPFFNFEVNAGGTLLLYHCTRTEDRGNVEVTPEDGATVAMSASLVAQPYTKIEPEITEPTDWCDKIKFLSFSFKLRFH